MLLPCLIFVPNLIQPAELSGFKRHATAVFKLNFLNLVRHGTSATFWNRPYTTGINHTSVIKINGKKMITVTNVLILMLKYSQLTNTIRIIYIYI